MKVSFTINDQPQSVDIEDGNTPLLWVIRDTLGLKGTKFGCGKAACGACTILIDGEAVRCCSYAVKFAEGKQITTIEGLGRRTIRIRCSKRGSRKSFRNAVIANRDLLWPRQR